MHTPGPWKVESPSDNTVVSIRNGLTVIHWYGFPLSDERAANARLVASAPELLYACEEALIELTSQAEYFGNHLDPENNLFRILRKLESVIAKAKGA